MALDLGDLDEFFDGGMLATVRGAKHPQGRQYRIPPVSAELGLWGRRVAVRRAELSDGEPADTPADLGDPPVPEGQTLEEAMLSPALHAELLADGVDDEMVRHMAKLVMGRIVGGDEVALIMARGEDPKGNRAQRRAAKKTAKTPAKASGSKTTSTAKAATTRKAASGSGTKSPTKNAGSGKPAAVSRGGKS